MKNIKLPTPILGSNLANLVVELETLRNNNLTSEINIFVFNQIKTLLNRLEILGSARIEGNNTTVMEYVEKRQEMDSENDKDGSSDKHTSISESIREILNIEEAVKYCEEYIKTGRRINRMLISDIHKLVVKDLKREGSQTPGEYRKINLSINKSNVILSDYTQVELDMEELFNFVEEEKNISNKMMKNAVAHHRYVIVHPFDNGNGRTARIFTYACLLRDGYSLVEKVINPTAVFCSNRNTYYDMLAIADKNTLEGMEAWCEYVLSGVKKEFEKIKKLTESDFVMDKIIKNTVEFSKDRNIINDKEYEILKYFSKKIEMPTVDLSTILPGMSKGRYSQIFKELRDRKLIIETRRGFHVINFNGPLMRGLIKSLADIDYLPVQDETTSIL